MKRVLKIGAMILVLAFGFAGCKSAQILNVPNQSVVAPNKITNDDVYKAISRAGGSLGWIIHKKSDGIAEATLNLRKHQAVVSINYNATDYSITYKSSRNLKYNAKDQTIHSNYNGWIQNLNNAINLQISQI